MLPSLVQESIRQSIRKISTIQVGAVTADGNAVRGITPPICEFIALSSIDQYAFRSFGNDAIVSNNDPFETTIGDPPHQRRTPSEAPIAEKTARRTGPP